MAQLLIINAIYASLVLWGCLLYLNFAIIGHVDY